MLTAYYKPPEREVFAERLMMLPGFVGAGVVLQNPFAPRNAWYDVYEVRWTRIPSRIGDPSRPALPRR